MPLYTYLLFLLLFFCLSSAFICFFERFMHIRSMKQEAKRLSAQLESLLEEKKWKEACRLCENKSHAFAIIIQAGLIQQAYGRTRIQSALEEAGLHQLLVAERPIYTLYVIAQIAPWVGLLAALLAATQFFAQEPSKEDLSFIMQHAFLCMACGLVIAISSWMGNCILKLRLESCAYEMEAMADRILDQLTDEKRT